MVLTPGKDPQKNEQNGVELSDEVTAYIYFVAENVFQRQMRNLMKFHKSTKHSLSAANRVLHQWFAREKKYILAMHTVLAISIRYFLSECFIVQSFETYYTHKFMK